MTFNEFQDIRDGIYKDFEIAKSNITTDGLDPKIPQATSLHGYVICRHPSEIAEKASNFSQEVAEIVPSLIFTPQHIHTTINVIPENIVFNDTVLEKLVQVIDGVRSKISPFEINFTKWAVNQNSIIAQGYSDKMFFNIADLIVNEARKMSIELKYPRMSHVTITRFLEPTKEQSKLEKLIKLVDKTEPLGISKINTLEVGFVDYREGRFDLIPDRTINILENVN